MSQNRQTLTNVWPAKFNHIQQNCIL